MIAATPLGVLEQALAWSEQADNVCLVTLVGIEGSSSRGLGTQMAVTASGKAIGSFSGGCIESAIVAEGREVLAEGQGRTVRFGAGSRYIDVRLPCGGGIDLLFTPDPDIAILRDACARLRARVPLRLHWAVDGVSWDGPGFASPLYPPLRIVALGQGEDLAAFVHLAAAHGASIEACTPHADQAALVRACGHEARHLAKLGDRLDITGDAWTAFAFLFHDRDWEDALLPQILAQPALYLGAIGSRRTHAARLERLRQANWTQAHLSRLRGHIGLIPATRDPGTLAISILAEIAAEYAAAAISPATAVPAGG